MAHVGKRLLAGVTDYLYAEGQQARDAVERDAYSLALAICGAVRRGALYPYKEACYMTFGCSMEKHITRRNQWRDLVYAELRDCASQRAQNALAAAAMPGFDAEPTGAEDASQPSIGVPLGNQQGAEGQDVATAQQGAGYSNRRSAEAR